MNTPRSNSTILNAKIQVVEPLLTVQQNRMWQHPELAQVFKQHLMQLYYSVNASVPLMARALARSQEMAADCAVAAALVPYYTEHIEEEQDHDEWVLEDLAVLGVTREEVLAKLPPATIATLIGSQYYYINHVHPLSMIGYLAVIEGKPINRDFLDELIVKTDMPAAALRSFYKHAELDVNHSHELWAFVDGLPLLPWHQNLLGSSALLTIELLARMTDGLISSFDASVKNNDNKALSQSI